MKPGCILGLLAFEILDMHRGNYAFSTVFGIDLSQNGIGDRDGCWHALQDFRNFGNAVKEVTRMIMSTRQSYLCEIAKSLPHFSPWLHVSGKIPPEKQNTFIDVKPIIFCTIHLPFTFSHMLFTCQVRYKTINQFLIISLLV